MRTPLLNFNGRQFVCQTSSSAKLRSPQLKKILTGKVIELNKMKQLFLDKTQVYPSVY